MEYESPQDQPQEQPVEEVSVEVEQVKSRTASVTRKLSDLRTNFDEIEVTNDERTMAALAHGSIVLTLMTGGFAGLLVAFVIWIVYRDKSRWVAGQAFQALVFQGAGTILAYGLALLSAGAFAISSLLTVILIGLCLFPFALLLGLLALVFPLAATLYGLFGAWETYQGRDFQYWWIGDAVRERTASS